MWQLLFTKDGHLDTSQLTLAILNAYFMIWVGMVSSSNWVMNDSLLKAFLIVYSTTVILASPSWLAKLWIENSAWFSRGMTAASALTARVTAKNSEHDGVHASSDIQEQHATKPKISTPEIG